ncbi:response regulator transcription factor [Streptomyces flaveus]|uniref:Uncharacterized protein n=1 Tax=Streptomyces flaveus TaxID=66370 RepID=A0A917RCP2_9ACTN|nr:response regulator transcription factor [Streptomyces flaveus]GGL01423.1 hypothetical protein GCM10010094_72800 [Streptomyces flaveus]
MSACPAWTVSRPHGTSSSPADLPESQLTSFEPHEYAYGALRTGAGGFRLADAHPDELLVGIRTVACGDAVDVPAIPRRLLETVTARIARPGLGIAPTRA